MSLLDLLVVAGVLLLCHFIPALAPLGIFLTVTVALIIERLIRKERVS